MAVTFEFWTESLIIAAKAIADEAHQTRRWLAPDAAAWERPAELLCVIVDDLNLALYIEENRALLAQDQLASAINLAEGAIGFDCGPDGWRAPRDVLADPAWADLRHRARAFIASFEKD
jgi:hypothetical protein